MVQLDHSSLSKREILTRDRFTGTSIQIRLPSASTSERCTSLLINPTKATDPALSHLTMPLLLAYSKTARRQIRPLDLDYPMTSHHQKYVRARATQRALISPRTIENPSPTLQHRRKSYKVIPAGGREPLTSRVVYIRAAPFLLRKGDFHLASTGRDVHIRR